MSVSDVGELRRAAPRGGRLALSATLLDPLIVGVLAAAVSLVGAGRPAAGG